MRIQSLKHWIKGSLIVILFFIVCMQRIDAQEYKMAKQLPFSVSSTSNVTSITLTWQWVPEADVYKIYRSEGDAEHFTYIGSVGNLEYTDRVVNKGNTTYYYRIEAYTGTRLIATSTLTNHRLQSKTAPMLSAYVIDYSGIDPYVQLNWDPVEGSTSYEVYRYTAKTKAYVKIATIAHSDKVFSFNYMDSDLALNQSYTYKIKALRTNEALYSNTITETLEPLATPNVKMEANTSYLHLSWDSIQKAKYYEIYRSTSPTMGFTRIAVIENYYTFYTNRVNNACKPNQTYYYKVRARRTINNKANYGAFSKVVSGNMHLAKPSMKASGGPQITLSWKEVPDASIYTIYRSTQSTTGFKAIACVSDNRYVQKGDKIKPNQRYYYRIIAKNEASGVKSSISNTVSAFISIGNPASTSAKASAVNANQIKITWKKATRATNYEIYRSTSKTKGFVKIATTANTTTYTDASSSLIPKKTYYYKIKPIRKYYQWKFVGSNSNVTMAMTQIPTTKITSISSPGKGKVIINWKKINNARYKLYRSTSYHGKYSLIKTITNCATTSYKNTGLQAGKKYYFKIKTYVTAGNKKHYDGKYTGTLSITTCKSHTKYDVVDTAIAQKKKPYKWGGSGPKNFDCSGLIYYAYRQNGYKVPRALAYAGHSIGKKTATIKMGDIVHYKNHFALVISKKKISNGYEVRVIEAMNTKDGIRENVYYMGENGPLFNKNFIGFRRI